MYVRVVEKWSQLVRQPTTTIIIIIITTIYYHHRHHHHHHHYHSPAANPPVLAHSLYTYYLRFIESDPVLDAVAKGPKDHISVVSHGISRGLVVPATVLFFQVLLMCVRVG